MTPAMPNEADHWARAWLMTLIDAAARAGLTPVTQRIIHHVAFLANVLAPTYGLPVEDGLVTRWKRGPYSRGLQWDLDRLALMGLARMSSVEPIKDADGAWFNASYSPGPLAREFLKSALEVDSLRKAHLFHCELMTAYASLPDAHRGVAATEDATYANRVDGDISEDETVIDFATWRDRNFTVRATGTLDRHLEGFHAGPRAKLHIYLRYLARRAAMERQAS